MDSIMDNHWIYFARHSDTVTTLGRSGTCWYCIARCWQAANNLWMERIHHSGIFTSQLYCNEWRNVIRRRFTDTKLHQSDCCEELCLKFEISQLCIDVKCKQTAIHYDDIKYAGSKLSSVERKLQNRNWKTTRQSNTAHILSQYVYFTT